jgi:tetratricopeptide (TPR) repeat protein
MPHGEKKQPEIITPADFPQKRKTAQPTKAGKRFFTGVLILAVVVLLIGVCVFWLLHTLAKKPVSVMNLAERSSPGATMAPEAKTEAVDTVEDQPIETAGLVKLSADAQKAEQTMAGFTLIRYELQGKGVSEWGGAMYARMIQLSQEADRAFVEKNFVTASERYTDATLLAENLAGQIEAAFEKMVSEGNMALDEGNGEVAQRKFEVALMIDPANKSAQHKLHRAKNIGAVMQLLASGNRHEKNGNLAFAHTDYQQAFRLDHEFEKAKVAFDRVKKLIKDEESQQLVSEGFAAYHNKDYQLAKKILVKARALKPESEEIRNVLSQVDQAILLGRIESLEKAAVKAENEENWEQALKSYMAVLDIDKNVQFAAHGKARSLKRIQIQKRIQFFLKNPNTLESNGQLKSAIMLIQEVENTQPKGPRFMAQWEDLNQLVRVAQTPVKVTIESDNLTEVAIYKVGKLGRFAVRELDLRPGTYTVVGARDGYKDVRQKMVVKPGQGPLRLSVKCRVKI